MPPGALSAAGALLVAAAATAAAGPAAAGGWGCGPARPQTVVHVAASGPPGGPAAAGADTYGLSAAFGGAPWADPPSPGGDGTLRAPLVVGRPGDGCARLAAAAAGAVVLLERGGCSFLDKARRVEEAGGVGMLVLQNASHGRLFSMGCTDKGGNATDRNVTAVGVMVPAEAGAALRAVGAAGGGAVALTGVALPPIDPSFGVLFALALAVLLFGTWHPAKPARGSPLPAEDPDDDDGPALPAISERWAVLFVVQASVLLVLLYFFMSRWFLYLIVGVFALAAANSAFALLRRAGRRALGARARPGPVLAVDAASAAAALGTAATWAVYRNAGWAWVLQDLLGAVFMRDILQMLRLPNVRVGALLLGLALVYDVFWVFIQPALFKTQESVMVEVATAGGSGEALPMLLRVPNLSPVLGGYAMLGFGDIVLPGLLVALALRLDRALPRGRRGCGAGCGYYAGAFLGYAAGLFLTGLALCFGVGGGRGQPALLYLVPCTLGAVAAVAAWRGELGAVWRADRAELQQRKRKSSAAGAEGGEGRGPLLEGGEGPEGLGRA